MTGGPGIPVAFVDDDADLRRATCQLLAQAGYAVHPFAGAKPALEAIDAGFGGPVVTDVRMPDLSGIDVFRVLHERDPDLPVILITGHADVGMAVDALKAGVWDFIEKPFAPDTLLAAIARAATARALTLENRRLREVASEAGPASAFVGRSASARHIRATIPMLADVDLDVVIEGATGTGKQFVARLIHRAGKRSRHAFVAIDCAAIPAAFLERELFATGGPIARAHRGTLFLDNLDRADPVLQQRLVQFVERRALNPQVRDPEHIDARIVAAIDHGALDAVEPALFHRLAGVTLRLAAIVERLDDLQPLFAHFARRAADHHGIKPRPMSEAAGLLARRDWPGNVREIELAAERFALGLDTARPAIAAVSLPDRMHAFEKNLIVATLRDAKGEVAVASDLLCIPRETLYYRIKRLGIDLKRLQREEINVR